MTNPFGNPFGADIGEIMDDAFRKAKAAKDHRDSSPTPLPQIRGKRIDGVLYVHAEDVADALAQLAPAVNKRLIDKFRAPKKPA